jgi:hypothetical protein
MGSKKNNVKSIRRNQRSYLNKDFDAFKAEMIQYGQIYFSDKINDFSENGVAGMFVEMAAMVGDNLSFYLDHQFSELDVFTAVEDKNVERLVRSAGVKIRGAAPATVDVDFYLEAPAVLRDNKYIPDSSSLPIIQAGTILAASSGVKFELIDDLNFSKTKRDGSFVASFVTMKSNSDGAPTTFSVKMSGLCSSAITSSESFTIPDKFVPFRTIRLSTSNVAEIITVKDSDGIEYYEVESLTQDTVYKRVANESYDSELVTENIEMIPAPYRFLTKTSRKTGSTTLRFGGGSAEGTDDDIMPDPSEVAIPLYGRKKTFSRLTLDPNKLLQTRTLGVSPRNTTISVRYRAGGGIKHNVSEKSIKTVSVLKTKFAASTVASTIGSVRASVEVNNPDSAKGGEAALTVDELRATALAFRNSQSRVVTRQDLVARVYTMPTKFGRVFRVGIRDNPSNPLAAVVSIISRDAKSKLVISPDTLKENLKLYLNEYRLISDAVDIVDARVVNIKIEYDVVVDATANKNLTIQRSNDLIKKYMSIENFQIDQPLVESDIINIILNTEGIISLIKFKVSSLSGTVGKNDYASEGFAVEANTDRGLIIPPPGSIFEIKYPSDDIIGTAR